MRLDHLAEAALLLQQRQRHLDVEEVHHEHAEVALQPQQLVLRVEHHLQDLRRREDLVQQPAEIVALDRVDRVVREGRGNLVEHRQRDVP